MPIFCVKSVKKTPIFCVKSVKNANFRVKSVKIYTGQKKFTRAPPVAPVTNMRYAEMEVPPSYKRPINVFHFF